MTFSFCNDILFYLEKKVEITVLMSENVELFNYVTSELAPYIVCCEKVTNNVFDFRNKMTSNFYKDANLIIDAIKEYLYKELYDEGFLKVHASVVSTNDLATVFIASCQKGKSSSEFLMGTRENSSFVSNDIAFIHPFKPVVVGYPSGFGLAPFSAKYLNLYDKSKIIDSTGVWFTSSHIRELGYKIKPVSEIGEIIFIDFHKGSLQDHFRLLYRCMFESLLGENALNNNKLSLNNLKNVMMIDLRIVGLCPEYEALLNKIINGRVRDKNGKILRKIL